MISSSVSVQHNFLCKPRQRWWRGEEERLFVLLGRMADAGILSKVWTDYFPYHRFGRVAQQQGGFFCNRFS